MQETILSNKKFIQAATALAFLLSLFVLALFINQIRSSDRAAYGGNVAPSISVTGTGEVLAVSDIATLSITMSKDGSTAALAQKDLNESVGKAVEYLKSQSIEDKDIKSEYGGLSPKYSYDQIMCATYPCPQRDPKITGYTATQSVTVKIRAVDNANVVRTGLATLGITNISGPNFSINDEEGFISQAREKAIDEAREKAQILARQLHVRLGKVISFSENGNTPYPMMYAKAEMSAGAMDGAIPPTLPKGENKIISNVTITYEIR